MRQRPTSKRVRFEALEARNLLHGDSLVISEFMASNETTLRDGFGQSSDWIELWNTTSVTLDLAGHHLTDDPENLRRWTFPAGTRMAPDSYLLIFASGRNQPDGRGFLHTNFKLKAGGEYLALVAPAGRILSQYGSPDQEYPAQQADVSYGLGAHAAGGGVHPTRAEFLVRATPGAPNSPSFLGTVADTRFSVDRGYYAAAIRVQISSATPGATIAYTLDGSAPSPTHGFQVPGAAAEQPPVAAVTVRETTTLRAMAYRKGWQPTNIDTHTYLFPADVVQQDGAGLPDTWGHAGADYTMDPRVVTAPEYRDSIVADLQALPALSLVTDLTNWFGTQAGIYPRGKGSPRPVSAELILPGGVTGFQIDGAVEIQGGSSTNRWKSDKLSMQLSFDSQYGESRLRYPLFGPERTDAFQTLILDARLNQAWHYGGGVTPQSQRERAQYVRDQFAADLQSRLGGVGPAGRPVHLYLNGLYWGLYNLHERPDEHFAAAYFGGDESDYDIIKHNREVVHGSFDNYGRLLDAANRDLSLPANYALLAGQLDIDSFIDYMLVNFFVGNEDWAHHNWYATYNRKQADGRWRFHSWDAEHSLKDVRYDATGKDDSAGPTHIHRQLTRSPEYRLQFGDRMQQHFFGDGLLTPQQTSALYQDALDGVYRAVVLESARWGDNQRSRPYTRDVEWMAERNRLLSDYFPRRTAIVLRQLQNHGLDPQLAPPQLNRTNGLVPAGFLVTMSSDRGAVFFTTDGSDPRHSPTARQYDRPLAIEGPTTIRARSYSGDHWSAVVEATVATHRPGDFSGNGQLDADDIDMLLAATRHTVFDPIWDLNADHVVDARDAHFWIHELASTRTGDANLDGVVDVHDFSTLAGNFGRADAHWGLGDFDGDGHVRLADFVLLAANFGSSRPGEG